MRKQKISQTLYGLMSRNARTLSNVGLYHTLAEARQDRRAGESIVRMKVEAEKIYVNT